MQARKKKKLFQAVQIFFTAKKFLARNQSGNSVKFQYKIKLVLKEFADFDYFLV